ncbi:hypothetical protein M8J77_019839 [Diaphorina citri]|nr:hypothetical protein M8J77_019839 [Diaphorina citri]
MAIKLDDLISKKKDSLQILDLSKSIVNSKEELRRLLEKVPEFKIKPEKVRPEDIKIKEKNFRFKSSRKEILKAQKEEYPFADPCPTEMKPIKLVDLSGVSIQWRMLTSLRPKLKYDEDYFSRLVDIAKSARQTREFEKRSKPDTDYIKKSKNRAGILETRIISCLECGEEFCDGECSFFLYECHQRNSQSGPSEETAGQGGDQEQSKKKKKKARKLLLGPSRARKKSKNKSRKQKDSSDDEDEKSAADKPGKTKKGKKKKSGGKSKSGEASASAKKTKVKKSPKPGMKSGKKIGKSKASTKGTSVTVTK